MATVIVNDCVSVSVPSVTSRSTLFGPTSPLAGVPDSVAVPLPLSVSVSHPGSRRRLGEGQSIAVGVRGAARYEYSDPCVAPVTGVDVKTGGSLTLTTVIVNDCVSVRDPSLT